MTQTDIRAGSRLEFAETKRMMKKIHLFSITIAISLLVTFSISVAQTRSARRNRVKSNPQTQNSSTKVPTLKDTFDWLSANFNFDEHNEYPCTDGICFSYSAAGNASFKTCTVNWRNNDAVSRNGTTRVVSFLGVYGGFSNS